MHQNWITGVLKQKFQMIQNGTNCKMFYAFKKGTNCQMKFYAFKNFKTICLIKSF